MAGPKISPLSVLQCDVPEGGLVPKSLYMNRDDEDEKDKDRSPEESPFGTDSLYHTAYVMKDWPHEVILYLIRASNGSFGKLDYSSSSSWSSSPSSRTLSR